MLKQVNYDYDTLEMWEKFQNDPCDENRSWFWEKIWPDYYEIPRGTKKSRKKRWLVRKRAEMYDIAEKINSLDCCKEANPPAVNIPVLEGYNIDNQPVFGCKKLSKKESAMYAPNITIAPQVNTTSSETDAVEKQRNYLRNRLSDIYCARDLEANRQFGLTDDKEPTTPQELIDRIKAGNIVISEAWTKEQEGSWSPRGLLHHFIRWRSPDKKEDKEGFKAWSMQTEKEMDGIKDSIAIKTPQEALTEIQAWEKA